MKFKKLTNEQIIISLDRLTRFKNTREKYLRVFSDILLSNLIEPKIKKQEIENLDFNIITSYTTEIFNNSLDGFIEEDLSINKFLQEYENKIFVNDEDTQKLLNNKINYKEAIKLINEDSPVNLRWLLTLSRKEQDNRINILREKYLLKYPIEKVILVEGITEEILLPAFSKFLGHDFYAKGLQILPAGGKNQVVKMYYKLAQELRIPIFVLLDKDAEENIRQIQPRLRDIDKIHLVSCGEFEDLLPKNLIVKVVNSHFKNFLSINCEDLVSELPTAKVLDEIFKTKGLHEFKKAEFAKLVKDMISDTADVSTEIKEIIEEIKLI